MRDSTNSPRNSYSADFLLHRNEVYATLSTVFRPDGNSKASFPFERGLKLSGYCYNFISSRTKYLKKIIIRRNKSIKLR